MSSPGSTHSRRSCCTPSGGQSRDLLWTPSLSPFNPERAAAGGGGGDDGQKPKKYIKQYELGYTLGKGSYAKVRGDGLLG
jgi:hypothetical protein